MQEYKVGDIVLSKNNELNVGNVFKAIDIIGDDINISKHYPEFLNSLNFKKTNHNYYLKFDCYGESDYFEDSAILKDNIDIFNDVYILTNDNYFIGYYKNNNRIEYIISSNNYEELEEILNKLNNIKNSSEKTKEYHIFQNIPDKKEEVITMNNNISSVSSKRMKYHKENGVHYFKMMSDEEYFKILPKFIIEEYFPNIKNRYFFDSERKMILFLEEDYYENNKLFRPYMKHLETQTLDCLINNKFCQIKITYIEAEGSFHSRLEFNFTYHN